MTEEKGFFPQEPQSQDNFEKHGKLLTCCEWQTANLPERLGFALSFDKKYSGLKRNVGSFLKNFVGKDASNAFRFTQDQIFNLGTFLPGSVFRLTASFPEKEKETSLAVLEQIKLKDGDFADVLLYGTEFPEAKLIGNISASWRDKFVIGQTYHDRYLVKDKKLEYLYRLEAVEVLMKGVAARLRKPLETRFSAQPSPIPTQS